MTIEKNKVVSIDYTLTDAQGELLDSSDGMGPLEYIHGHRNIIPGLEKVLTGKKAGDSFKTEVEAIDAYGEYRKDLVIEVPRTQFPEDVTIEVGMQFEADSPEGSSVVTVTDITGDTVTVDANHPLAGEKLFFDVTVADIRDATEEELQNGLSHGCGCGHDCGSGCGGDCDCEDGCDCEDDCGCESGGCGCGH